MKVVSRLASFLILLSGIYFFPWWLTALLGIGALFLFGFFAEFIIIAFIYDSLYGGASGGFWGIPYSVTILSIFIFIAVHVLKRRLLFYTS